MKLFIFSLMLISRSSAHMSVNAGGMFGNLSCGTDPVKEVKGAQGAGISLWSNGVVPFVIDRSFLQVDTQVFNKAIALIQAKTCVRFVQKSGNVPHLWMRRLCACGSTANGCFSGGYTNGLGSANPRQLVMSSACLDGNSASDLTFMVHEIFHALGVIHTQNRPDRDSYVAVHEQNIQPNARSQYTKCSSCNTYGTAYNCMSTMHYRDYFFNVNNGKTMTARVANCNLQTYPVVMTDSDWNLINKMYCRAAPVCAGGNDAWSCCSQSNQCGLGGGDCDTDADCKSGLMCGTDNCRDFHANAHQYADCCIEELKCKGGNSDWNCCTSQNPCPINQGDCDSDSDCQDGLVCGKDNCQAIYPNAHPAADCCIKRAPRCDGGTDDWSCCSRSQPCGYGEGDCDQNSDCQSGLRCGRDNCRSFHS